MGSSGVSIPNSPSPGYGVHPSPMNINVSPMGGRSRVPRAFFPGLDISLSLSLFHSFVVAVRLMQFPGNLLLVINKWPNGEWIYHLLLRNL